MCFANAGEIRTLYKSRRVNGITLFLEIRTLYKSRCVNGITLFLEIILDRCIKTVRDML